MAKKAPPQPVLPVAKRRRFDEEFRREAVQMMLDGHTAASVAERLGLTDPTILYIWKKKLVTQSGPVAAALDDRVKALEAELHRVERERDILKKA